MAADVGRTPPHRRLEIGILDPAVTQRLIAQVVNVLEKRQACHQPRRQRRAAGAIRIDRSELRLQKPPIDRARKLHQCMRQIMIRSSRERNRSCSRSLVAPAAASLTLPRSSRGQGITASDSKESQKQFARQPQRRRPIPVKTITGKGSITLLVEHLGNTSRPTNSTRTVQARVEDAPCNSSDESYDAILSLYRNGSTFTSGARDLSSISSAV
jgi:hypothetical protein